jgi:hypothetical protein
LNERDKEKHGSCQCRDDKNDQDMSIPEIPLMSCCRGRVNFIDQGMNMVGKQGGKENEKNDMGIFQARHMQRFPRHHESTERDKNI